MKSWIVTTINQPKQAAYALKVSAASHAEAMDILTKDAMFGGYQIKPEHIITVVEVQA